MEDITIKISRSTYKKIREIKAKTKVPIKHIVDSKFNGKLSERKAKCETKKTCCQTQDGLSRQL